MEGKRAVGRLSYFVMKLSRHSLFGSYSNIRDFPFCYTLFFVVPKKQCSTWKQIILLYLCTNQDPRKCKKDIISRILTGRNILVCSYRTWADERRWETKRVCVREREGERERKGEREGERKRSLRPWFLLDKKSVTPEFAYLLPFFFLVQGRSIIPSLTKASTEGESRR